METESNLHWWDGAIRLYVRLERWRKVAGRQGKTKKVGWEIVRWVCQMRYTDKTIVWLCTLNGLILSVWNLQNKMFTVE